MLIIVNQNIPDNALYSLKRLGKVFLFDAKGITYPEISGHIDIFTCQVGNELIIAPNCPKKLLKFLDENRVIYRTGKSIVGAKYPATAHYNAVVTDDKIIHNTAVTDDLIRQLSNNKQYINVNQAYTRCNLLPIGSNNFITSDLGVYKILKSISANVLYIKPDTIVLPGFKHGFFGGACGVVNDTIYVLGSISALPNKKQFLEFIENAHCNFVELYDGPLYDAGSILMMDIN